MAPTPTQLLQFFLPGYLLTVAIEAPILLLLLSRRHAWRERLSAGLLLTAFTYPIVVLVLPPLLWNPFGYTVYISIAETFAPLAECAVFYAFWIRPKPEQPTSASLLQDMAAITAANVASWLGGAKIIALLFRSAV